MFLREQKPKSGSLPLTTVLILILGTVGYHGFFGALGMFDSWQTKEPEKPWPANIVKIYPYGDDSFWQRIKHGRHGYFTFEKDGETVGCPVH